MSVFSFRPRGGMNGIETNQNEMATFAKEIGARYLDEFIPLPGVGVQQQKAVMKSCAKDHNAMESVHYYETTDGSHGWCCTSCGEVLQWG